MMDLPSAIIRVNELGQKRIPFLLLVDFEMEKIKVLPFDEIPEGLQYNFNGLTNEQEDVRMAEGPSKVFEVDPFPFDKYYHQFDKVLDEIKYGNTFLINLTAQSRIKTSASLKEIYSSAQAKYKLLFEEGDAQIVVYSPETFVKISDGHIYSYPMKGTIEASETNSKEKLLSDAKELAEHRTIVDLIRNDLSIVAKEVAVTKFRYLDLIKSNNKDLYQASSEIRGRLPEDHLDRLGDLVFSLLPAGSICGAPKTKTVRIIQEVESQKRGYYTGIAGLFDGKNFDSCVMIRFVEEEKGKKYYRSGGGITFQSEVENEYQELIDKIYLPC